ncbi:MAG: hypothetical protein Q8N60_02655 [Candidatus Diapherotrites archaeon]|nr:hypothetical protein [Candidatus Diapherotrites archaeon]
MPKPRWRPGKKGLERRIRYGVKGPKMETLIKTVTKRAEKFIRRARKRDGYDFSKIMETATKKRFRNDARIGFARAMDAISLDPKKPAEKKLRAELHRLAQKISDLQYETNFDPDARRDPEKHHELQETRELASTKILRAKGEEALERFNAVYLDKMSGIQIAHEEAARQIRKKQL